MPKISRRSLAGPKAHIPISFLSFLLVCRKLFKLVSFGSSSFKWFYEHTHTSQLWDSFGLVIKKTHTDACMRTASTNPESYLSERHKSDTVVSYSSARGLAGNHAIVHQQPKPGCVKSTLEDILKSLNISVLTSWFTLQRSRSLCNSSLTNPNEVDIRKLCWDDTKCTWDIIFVYY